MKPSEVDSMESAAPRLAQERPRRMSRKLVLRNALSLVIGSGFAQACMAVVVLLVGRQLGPEQFGRYAACFSATALASILFDLGLDGWLLVNGSGRQAPLSHFVSRAMTIKLVAGVPWIALMVMILPRLNPATFQLNLVLLCAFAAWMEGLFSLMLTVFKTLLRNRSTSALLIASRGGILLTTVVLIVIGSQNPVVFAEGRLIVGVLMVIITGKFLPVKWMRSSLADLWETGRGSLTYALGDLLASVYVQADVTIASIFLTSAAVGLYSPASSLVGASFVIPSALFYVAVPVLTQKWETRDPKFPRDMEIIVGGFAALGLCMCLIVWGISAWLPILLLGASYQKSGQLLAILSPILFLKWCSFGLAAILVAVGWQSKRNYAQATSAVANVGLNFALIATYGITAVAAVYVVSELVLTTGYVICVILWTRRVMMPSLKGPGCIPELSCKY